MNARGASRWGIFVRMRDTTIPARGNSRPVPGPAGRSPTAILESLVEDELLEWYLMTPQERWAESQRLWETFTLLGGSLEPEPDSQSPFDVPGGRGRGPAHGRPGVHSIRRSGV
jgi:hypothetical protein